MQRTSTTNGVLKAEAAAAFAQVLVGSGIEYFDALPDYDESSRLVMSLKAVHGQRSGISTAYFWMLAGADDLIKPDRMILAFIVDTLRRRISAADARRLLAEAVALLRSDFPHLSARLLDYEVWRFQRGQRRAAAQSETRQAAPPIRRRRSEDLALHLFHRPSDAGDCQQSPIEDALEQAGRELQTEFGAQPVPVARLRDRTAELCGCSTNSVLPSDYTYNRVNRARVSMQRPMFVHEGQGYYRYIGKDACYSGPVLWKPNDGGERVVGYWQDGELTLEVDPRTV